MFFEFAIIGPTASGKSSLCLELAKRLGAVVLSLDSLCVYKDINIANAKPSKKDLEEIRHFGINLINLDTHFCVWDFMREYERARDFAQASKSPLIICGGSSFYLRSLLDGLSPRLEATDIDISDEEIWSLARRVDKEIKFSKNDKFRLAKWYQIYAQTKEPPSKWLRQNCSPPLIKSLDIFSLEWDRDELRSRIKKRTELMIELGLIEEARELFNKYRWPQYPSSPKALNSIGLKECKDYLAGELSLDELINLINIHTARLAKRQRTFNKKFDNLRPLDAKSLDIDEFIRGLNLS